MGQKVNPIGLRITVTKDWRSRWVTGKKNFGDFLHEDLEIRSFVKKSLRQAAVSRVQIERFANRIRVIIHSGRPGLVYGKQHSAYESLRNSLHKLTKGKEVYVDVKTVHRPEIEAQLVAENIAMQLERRIGFKRAMKKAIQSAMDMGALGIKIRCSGRLGGSELARTEQDKRGKIPLHTLRADISYGFIEANTPAGKIGIKTWICHPDMTEEEKYALNTKTYKVQKGTARKPRRKSVQKQQT